MKRHPYISIIYVSILLTYCSCASLLNSSESSIKVITNEPSQLQFDEDSYDFDSEVKILLVDRSEKTLTLTATSGSSSKTIEIPARNSFAYWMNLFCNYGAGMLVDMNNPKRYSYPRIVYIDFEDHSNSYLRYVPYSPQRSGRSLIIKSSPLKYLGMVNPAAELAIEKWTGSHFSTEIMGSILLPDNAWNSGYYSPKTNGFSASIEEKYYYRGTAPSGPYVGLEAKYYQSEYRDIWRFGIADIYSDTSSFMNYTDTFRLQKNTMSLTLKLGHQIIRNRMTYDFYLGLGVKYRDVRHFDRIDLSDEMEFPRHPNIYYIANKEGGYWTLSIPLNFRIGYTF